MKGNYKTISKLMSLALRHNPHALEIELDDNGWADVEALLIGLQKNGKNINLEILRDLVATNDKKRFAFNEDLSKIRASQGHSVDISLELRDQEPPEVLYHGTVGKFMADIKTSGLLKMSRQYVHLSSTKETAEIVARRRGVPIILVINAQEMYKDGLKFYCSENHVWLTDNVPAKYIS